MVSKENISKLYEIILHLTCYKLRKQHVVAIDNIDRHISGRLQEQRTALRRHGGQV